MEEEERRARSKVKGEIALLPLCTLCLSHLALKEAEKKAEQVCFGRKQLIQDEAVYIIIFTSRTSVKSLPSLRHSPFHYCENSCLPPALVPK